VKRQPAHRHRLLSRFPVRIILGNAFQRTTRIRYLGIKVDKKYFGNSHTATLSKLQLASRSEPFYTVRIAVIHVRLAATVLTICGLAATASSPAPLPPLSSVADPAAKIFAVSCSTALIFIAVRGDEVKFQFFGETAPGSGKRPDEHSFIRLCSITKVFTTDLLVQLVAGKQVRLRDTLQRFAPAGMHVPSTAVRVRGGPPITLFNLATHTAGLPREIGPAPPGAPHFTYPSFEQRWVWLQRVRLVTPAGSAALYSNVAFDFLADALQAATHVAYPRLLASRIFDPLGMHDTTFDPTPDQCAHLLQSTHDEGPCTSTENTAGSSGLYSTPDDIARWLRYLTGDDRASIRQDSAALAIYVTSAQLRGMKGLDHAGKPSGIGLGWLRLGRPGDPSRILEKTGSGAGFTTYVAVTPAERAAVFFAFTEGHGHWHTNPFAIANDILLALSNLPPLPQEKHVPVHRPRHPTRHLPGIS
jgi:D-alanyl-D-alanine-carboxypeptidase/D-alanyl-D-alanine-endopeptidase